jgi:protein-disulfide isomerase
MPDRSKPKPRSNAKPSTGPSPTSRLLVLAAIGIPVILVVLGGIALLGDGGQAVASSTPPASTAPAPSDAGVLVRDDSPALGPADAPVTLVEFLDPECESCRAFYPIVKEVLDDYAGDVRLVVRYVPGHANSALAAIALEAAREQDETKYWEMLELLFERQPEWGERQEPQPQAFLDAAAAVGLDVGPIQTAMDAGDTSMVERDLADALAVDVGGTPTFFVNGTEVSDLSPEGLRAAIDAALAS